MRDKISKLRSVIKKYGLALSAKKAASYIRSNYLPDIGGALRVLLHKNHYEQQLKHILAENRYDRILIFRSAFGWNVPLYQRPQHMFTNLAAQNCLVFYEVSKFTDPQVKLLKKQRKGLYLVNFRQKAFAALVIKKVMETGCPRYIQFYSTDWTLSAAEVRKWMEQGFRVIYEYIDDLNPALAGTKDLPVNVAEKYELAMREEEWVTVVVTADALLADVKRHRSKNLVYACNGVDYRHFRRLQPEYVFEKEFQDILNSGKPIIGYYGALAGWFDYPLVKQLAVERPDYEIVLIGIFYDDSYKTEEMEKFSNIHYLGPRDYTVLPQYGARMDVLTIPFRINQITRATSPVKLFEYMALHKPIVTTDMDECRKYKSVLIGKNSEEFLRQIDRALELAQDTSYLELLDTEARENTWDKKAEALLTHLRNEVE